MAKKGVKNMISEPMNNHIPNVTCSSLSSVSTLAAAVYDMEFPLFKCCGQDVEKVKKELGFKEWEEEDFDSTINHFNETNWLIFQSEYDEIIRIEIGAIIKDDDEFDWKYKPALQAVK
jgi:hypothetical protein